MIETVLLTKEDFNKMNDLLEALNKKIDSMVPPNAKTMMDNTAFIAHMSISKRTAQTWRDEGRISFSQIGNKIYYQYTDVERFIENHKIDAFKINWKQRT